MRIDRVAENVYVFISDLYVQVVSTAILTAEGVVVVDALAFPSEAREAISFIERTQRPGAIRYLILTHHHADHTYGAYLFEGAEVLAQVGCREMLERIGPATLARAKRETPALAEVELRLPNMTFERELHLHLGDAHLQVFHTPGHTEDGISVFYVEEKILITGDAMMPVPHIVHGDVEALKASLQKMLDLNPSFIIQGHGEVILRGEVEENIRGSIAYLDTIVARVSEVIEKGAPPSTLREIDIESCGRSRIPLDGMVSRLHLNNLIALYKRMAPR